MACGALILFLLIPSCILLLILGAMAWSYLNETSPSGSTNDALRGTGITAVVISVVGFIAMFFLKPWAVTDV